MFLEKLYVNNIRAIKNHQIEFKKGVNIIWGENGTGKTTILESIHLLSITKSFRHGKNIDIITQNQELGTVKGMFSKKQTIKTNIFPNQKTFHLNNVQIKPTHEIIGKFPTTVLSPEDIDVVSGGNAIKLRFIDKILSTTDKQYFFTLKEFKRVLKQRNKTLSQGNRELVSMWDDKLAKTTQKIWKKRDQFFQEFSQIFNRSWKSAPQHHVGEVFYSRKQLNKKDVFLQELQNNIERDLILKTTTTGAHKDKVEFKLDKKNIKEFGSQGEKKLFLSNLKFSEAEYISKTTHTEPVLLLDDLFEKLDIEKINYILNKTKKFTQSIITTTDNSIESVVPHINGLNKIQIQHV